MKSPLCKDESLQILFGITCQTRFLYICHFGEVENLDISSPLSLMGDLLR